MTTTTKDVEKNKSTTTKREIAQAEPIVTRSVYIGDTVDLDLIQDTVYIGGMPPMIKDKLKKYPEIERLFVPVHKMVEAKKRLRQPGTVEYLANIAIKEER